MFWQKIKLEYLEKLREGKLWIWPPHRPCAFPPFYRYYSFIAGVVESSLFKPGTLSQDDVLLIAHELGSSWKMVGRVLNVPDSVIDMIEEEAFEVSEKCYSRCYCVVFIDIRTVFK